MPHPLEHESYEAFQKALIAEDAHLKTAQQALSEQVDILQNALTQCKKAIDEELHNSIQSADNTQKHFETFIAYLKSFHDDSDEAEALKKELESIAENNAAAQERIKTLEQENGELHEALQAGKSRIATLEKEVGDTSAQIAQKEEKIESIEAQLQEQHTHDGALKTQLEQLQAENEALCKAQEDLQSRVEKMEAEQRNSEELAQKAHIEMETLRSENTALQESVQQRVEKEVVDTLRQQLEQEQDRAALLEQQLQEETAKGTKSVLATQLAEALKDAEDAHKELLTLRQEYEKLRRIQGVPAAKCDEDMKQRIQEAAKKYSNGQKGGIGEILVEVGILEPTILQEAVEEQRRNPQQHLGDILIEKDLVSEDTLAQVFATLSEAPLIALSMDKINPDAAALISERLANQHTCIPLRLDGENLLLAMANPMDLLALEDIERATNHRVQAVVATTSEIKAAISQYYWEPE